MHSTKRKRGNEKKIIITAIGFVDDVARKKTGASKEKGGPSEQKGPRFSMNEC